jgi:hypothetical protein
MRTLCIVTALAVAGSLPAAAVPLLSHGAPGAAPAVIEVDAHLGDVADDADFLFRLGMLEGHLLVGHELLQAHQPALALPHFGHPVRELYDDVADNLKAKQAPGFDTDLVQLEALVAAAPDSPDTEAKYQAVIAAVHRARDVAPPELRASLPEMIKICSDTIDAASGEFGESLEHGRVAVIVEYHDSRGFLEYVAQQVGDLKEVHKDASSQTLLDRFTAVLAKAQWIVGDLLPGATPRASVGTYRAVASEAAQLAKQ